MNLIKPCRFYRNKEYYIEFRSYEGTSECYIVQSVREHCEDLSHCKEA